MSRCSSLSVCESVFFTVVKCAALGQASSGKASYYTSGLEQGQVCKCCSAATYVLPGWPDRQSSRGGIAARAVESVTRSSGQEKAVNEKLWSCLSRGRVNC